MHSLDMLGKIALARGINFFIGPLGMRRAINRIDDGKKDRSALHLVGKPTTSVIGCPLKGQDNILAMQKCNWFRNFKYIIKTRLLG